MANVNDGFSLIFLLLTSGIDCFDILRFRVSIKMGNSTRHWISVSVTMPQSVSLSFTELKSVGNSIARGFFKLYLEWHTLQ